MKWLTGETILEGYEELQLSQDITSFEKDFSSGYLIGEILD